MGNQEVRKSATGAREVVFADWHACYRCDIRSWCVRRRDYKRTLLSARWSEYVYPAGLAIVCRRICLHISAEMGLTGTNRKIENVCRAAGRGVFTIISMDHPDVTSVSAPGRSHTPA
jgi:hypothetical protein